MALYSDQGISTTSFKLKGIFLEKKNIDKFKNTSINVECYDLIYNNKIEFIKMTKAYRIYAQLYLLIHHQSSFP